ncbi:MAG: glycosyltransferase family 2 protein, partial [Phototrophicaceae bacterium]
IGLRLTQMGANIQIVYDAVQATQEETPDSIEQFVKQRTRWNQGFYQIFAKGLWRQLPSLKQRITAIYILLNSLLQASIMLFLPVGIFIAVTQEVPVPIAIISYLHIYILIVQLMLNMVGIREFTEAYGLKIPLFFRFKMLAWFYPFQLMLSFSAVRAVGSFLTNQSSWEKTTHSNLHREASGAATPAHIRA